MAPRARSADEFQVHAARADVPQGRNGKHKQIVTQILSDLDQVEKGIALRGAAGASGESKEKVRSALNRATRQRGPPGGDGQRRHLLSRLDGNLLALDRRCAAF